MKKLFLLFFIFLVSGNVFASENNEIGSNFILTDHNGNLFDSSKIKQKYLLVFFGYSTCPSICPTAMNELTYAIKNRKNILSNSQPVFISLDPTVDSPEKMKEFHDKFDKNIIMLTSTKKDLSENETAEEKIKSLSQKYKLYVSKVTKGDSYEIDHSSFFYLINKNTGKYVGHSGMNREDIIRLFDTN